MRRYNKSGAVAPRTQLINLNVLLTLGRQTMPPTRPLSTGSEINYRIIMPGLLHVLAPAVWPNWNEGVHSPIAAGGGTLRAHSLVRLAELHLLRLAPVCAQASVLTTGLTAGLPGMTNGSRRLAPPRVGARGGGGRIATLQGSACLHWPALVDRPVGGV